MAFYTTSSNPNNSTPNNNMLSEMSPNEDSIYDYMASSSLLYSQQNNASSDHAQNNDDDEETLSLFDFEDSVFIGDDTSTTNNPPSSQLQQPLPSVSNYYELDSIQHPMHLGHEPLLPPSDDDIDDNDVDNVDDDSYYQEDDDELSQLYDNTTGQQHNTINNPSQHSQESQIQITFEPIELSPTLNAVNYDTFPLSDPENQPLSPTPPSQFNDKQFNDKQFNDKQFNDNIDENKQQQQAQLIIPNHVISKTSQSQLKSPTLYGNNNNNNNDNPQNKSSIRDISNKLVERQHHHRLSVIAASPQISPSNHVKSSKHAPSNSSYVVYFFVYFTHKHINP